MILGGLKIWVLGQIMAGLREQGEGVEFETIPCPLKSLIAPKKMRYLWPSRILTATDAAPPFTHTLLIVRVPFHWEEGFDVYVVDILFQVLSQKEGLNFKDKVWGEWCLTFCLEELESPAERCFGTFCFGGCTFSRVTIFFNFSSASPNGYPPLKVVRCLLQATSAVQTST